MSKVFFLLVTISFLLLSCNYKQLGCVICKTGKRKEIKKYSNNSLQEIKIVKYRSRRATDVPVRTITKIWRYDSLGNRIERSKVNKIASVWKWEPRFIKSKIRTDSLNGKFCIIEKKLKKNGVIVMEFRKIKEK